MGKSALTIQLIQNQYVDVSNETKRILKVIVRFFSSSFIDEYDPTIGRQP